MGDALTETPLQAVLEGGVLTMTLNRPERLNAMSQELIGLIIEQLDRALAESEVRAVLITGTGRGFCAGADLAGTGTGTVTGPDGKPDFGVIIERLYSPMIRAIRELPKPVIAAVNGVAAGGGANLALACDIVLAARSARFDQAFVRIGLLPDLGGTWFLPHAVGDARARALAMLGTSVPAEEAERMGMIWQVVEDPMLMVEATRLARQLASGPALSYAAIKRAINAAATNTLDRQRALGQSADSKEGVAAFLAKRPAQFTGR
jgi:2-(1,2-epoxy-1,2-dihydrophenyl)acetyl-CoA isomerase